MNRRRLPGDFPGPPPSRQRLGDLCGTGFRSFRQIERGRARRVRGSPSTYRRWCRVAVSLVFHAEVMSDPGANRSTTMPSWRSPTARRPGRVDADGDGLGDAGRGVAGAGGLVARRDREGHAGGDGVPDGRVERGRWRRRRGSCWRRPGPRVPGDPVDARDDLRGGAGALVVEDADGDDLGLLGDAVGGAGDGARDVGAVAVAVAGGVVVVDGVEAVARPGPRSPCG